MEDQRTLLGACTCDPAITIGSGYDADHESEVVGIHRSTASYPSLLWMGAPEMNQYHISRQYVRSSDKPVWRDTIRKLLHHVQFDSNLMLSIDRILNRIVYADPQSTPRDYLNAITLALASEQLLSGLSPHFRHEAIVRQFLAALKYRLENDQERR